MGFDLRNKWVLITGASSGFGEAAALAFAREGARLLLGARREERLQDVAKNAIKAGAPSALFHKLDVSSHESVNAFVAFVKKQTDAVHLLINNAGGAHGMETVAEGRDEDWEAMFDSNVIGLLRMTRGIIPLLSKDPGTTILNIGSIAGHVAYENGAAYCGAKAAELSITRALRLELNGTGIRVTTLDPGLAETEFATVRFKGDTTRAKKTYDGMTPLSARDVADTMVWIASRPPHVCIAETLILPTAQANVYKVHRKKD
jgi:3-hydroxy acid dehydrogenase/malonic semialdehyde reductase